MNQDVIIAPLTADAFQPFGDVIDTTGRADALINQGLCERFHDLACLEAEGGRLGLSLFRAQPRALPFKLDMMERHPLGSQTFIPMHSDPFLVIVALDVGGKPAKPMAFQTAPYQAINFHRGTWHGVLTPLQAPGIFAVVDRIGTGNNLEEFWFDTPFCVTPS